MKGENHGLERASPEAILFVSSMRHCASLLPPKYIRMRIRRPHRYTKKKKKNRAQNLIRAPLTGVKIGKMSARFGETCIVDEIGEFRFITFAKYCIRCYPDLSTLQGELAGWERG